MANLVGDSSDANVTAVAGHHSGTGRGVEGYSTDGVGVWGESRTQSGVTGHSETLTGLWGESRDGQGVHGHSINQAGVAGFSDRFVGVWGESSGDHPGVLGKSGSHAGVTGVSEKFIGMLGESRSTHPGVLGKSQPGPGVHGESVKQAGVLGTSKEFVGVWAHTDAVTRPALLAKGPRIAARFEGDVEVTGDVRLVNADCAEQFDITAPDVEHGPGTVMVINGGGQLQESRRAYDRRVAGVVSGAGTFRPGLLLDAAPSESIRVPLALLGKVYCKVDADRAAVDVGDLLTTSDTPGHAMKAADPHQAFGCVIGKALQPLKSGKGMVPILVALQ